MGILSTWLTTTALTRGLSTLENIYHNGHLDRKIRDSIKTWIDTVPEEYNLIEGAMFPLSENSIDFHICTKLSELRDTLKRDLIPSLDLWQEALLEHWMYRKTTLGEDAQAFFVADEAEVKVHIYRLAESLYQVVHSDKSSREATTIETILSGQNIPFITGVVKKHLEVLIDEGRYKDCLDTINSIRRTDSIDEIVGIKETLVLSETEVFLKTHARGNYETALIALESLPNSFDKQIYLVTLSKHSFCFISYSL